MSYLSWEVEVSVLGFRLLLGVVRWNTNNQQNRKCSHPNKSAVCRLHIGFPNCYSDWGAITCSGLPWYTNSHHKLQWKGIHGINNNISHFWVKWLLPNRDGNAVIYLRSQEEKKLSNITALWKLRSKPFQNISTTAQAKICKTKGVTFLVLSSIRYLFSFLPSLLFLPYPVPALSFHCVMSFFTPLLHFYDFLCGRYPFFLPFFLPLLFP